MPESSFPQIMGVISKKERSDPRWLAALYIACTFPPTPISLDEAEACMKGGDEEILFELGKALASKLSRPTDQVIEVVWKTTRTVGMHKGLLATKGKFVIIHRNPINVFESQFRVSFGKGNRNPLRFAIFNESYQNAFNRIPQDRKYEMNYDDLPDALEDLLEFLGVEDTGEWQDGKGAMDLVAERCSWLNQITSVFENTDALKRDRLDVNKVKQLEYAMAIARPLRPLLRPVRSYFDESSVTSIRERAKQLLG